MTMNIRKTATIILSLLCSGIMLLAQDRVTVKGVVTDENDNPMIGAGVYETGTTNGVVTDIDGNYSIEVAKNGSLTYSYISYSDQTIKVNNQAVINVQLQPDNNLLDEVVVIGYNTVKKSDLTGASTSRYEA